mmetsp:Transcript_13234/g.30109  ORF Transcript_13234/g.30109 Transcript_13234/m.30109 type:complete len:171 (+) Transcript_13234:36-548(+)
MRGRLAPWPARGGVGRERTAASRTNGACDEIPVRRRCVLLLALMWMCCSNSSSSFCQRGGMLAAQHLTARHPLPQVARGAVAPENELPEALEAASAKKKQPDDWLDTPILDSNEYGGPLEPLKQLIRDDPEMGTAVMSGIALVFIIVLIKVVTSVVSSALDALWFAQNGI